MRFPVTLLDTPAGSLRPRSMNWRKSPQIPGERWAGPPRNTISLFNARGEETKVVGRPTLLQRANVSRQELRSRPDEHHPLIFPVNSTYTRARRSHDPITCVLGDG